MSARNSLIKAFWKEPIIAISCALGSVGYLISPIHAFEQQRVLKEGVAHKPYTGVRGYEVFSSQEALLNIRESRQKYMGADNLSFGEPAQE